MTRRAVIYIRTSSETQGEKSSPAEQETVSASDDRAIVQRDAYELVHAFIIRLQAS